MGAPAGIAAAAGAQALSLGVLEGHGREPSAQTQSGSSLAVPPKLRLVRKMLERAFLDAPRSRTRLPLAFAASGKRADHALRRNVDRSTWICEDRRWRDAAAVHDPQRCRARTL